MRGIYYYPITCLFWLPTVNLALCQLLKIKAQSQNSLFFRPYHVECCHWTRVLKESARRKLHSTQTQPQARVLKRWPDVCSAILPTKLTCLLMADSTPPELKHPDLEPTWCTVKTLEIMCTTHLWEVYALVLSVSATQLGRNLCLWCSIFDALQRKPVLPASTVEDAGGTERHPLGSWGLGSCTSVS